MSNQISSKLQFLRGSKKYFLSSLLIPRQEHEKMTTVYNFCRLTDDFVDEPEKHNISFHEFRIFFYELLENFDASKELKLSDSEIHEAHPKLGHTADTIYTTTYKFIALMQEKQLKLKWVEALFDSMQMDLDRRDYVTLDQSLEYVYGVAEVVGLMVSKTYEIDPKAYRYAKLAGRAAQWANFIRDIGHDLTLDRTYFPTAILEEYGVLLNKEFAQSNPEKFQSFIDGEIARYESWIKLSQEGYPYLPAFLRRSLSLSNFLDSAVLAKIKHDPIVIFDKQVKPKKRDLIKAISYLPLS